MMHSFLFREKRRRGLRVYQQDSFEEHAETKTRQSSQSLIFK